VDYVRQRERKKKKEKRRARVLPPFPPSPRWNPSESRSAPAEPSSCLLRRWELGQKEEEEEEEKKIIFFLFVG